ncbi:MAG: hypothetical protein KDE49_16705 [Novosphingobium sp.]|nr:hypothetical protein [Novosphingobium sp.]
MPGNAKDLCDLSESADRFNLPSTELSNAQLVAVDERFQAAKKDIKLVRLRAEEAGLERIRSFDDLVQLLLPHTAYKSYPENWLLQGRWSHLTKWLETVSTYPIGAIEYDGISGIDEWLARLEKAGHFISCSSGTTGKSAMLNATQRDMDWAACDVVNVFSWGSRVKPLQDRLVVNCVGVADVPKNIATRAALKAAFGQPEGRHWQYPVPPITVGSLTNTILLRKAIADGVAMPEEIAEFQRIAAERQQANDSAVEATAEFLIANRDQKFLLIGFWAGFYPIAKAIREMGYSAQDFHADNALYVGGGLKGAQLPNDFEVFIYETLNIRPERYFQMYSMQEINSGMPKCQEGGRYHIPPWLIPLVLNESGDALMSASISGEIEGRAAFFDLSLDGRWGGVISGDKITVDYAPCPCGQRGATIHNNISRYIELKGDDKIGCSGTIDAYVRSI